MFEQAQAQTEVARGNFLTCLPTAPRLAQVPAQCLLIGVPLWFVVGILITLAPEFGRELGLRAKSRPGWRCSGATSGWCLATLPAAASARSGAAATGRLQLFLVFCARDGGRVPVWHARAPRLPLFYAVCFVLGLSVGFWALFVTVAAEQFGTNLRATVATTAPNFARGSVVLLVPLFQLLSAAPLGLHRERGRARAGLRC